MTGNGYGLWGLVALNIALFLIFAVSFFHPRTRRDWRALGAFSAFLVALLTVYLLTGPLSGLIPGVDLSHNAPFHLASYAFIGGGLLQWPTLATLVMFPVLLLVYRRLALREERDVRAEFGTGYDAYAAGRPRFVPRLPGSFHGTPARSGR